MGGVILCWSCDVEIVQVAGGLFNMEGKRNGGVGGKKVYISLSSWDFLVQLARCDNVDSYPVFWWLTNTKWPSLHCAQPPVSWWMRILEMRGCTCGEECFRCEELLLHATLRETLWPCAARRNLSSSHLVPPVQPSNTATNAASSGMITHNWCYSIVITSLFTLRCFYLCQWVTSTTKLMIYTIDGSKYCAKNECNTMITTLRRHKHPSSGANRPSDIAVTVNINAELNLSSIWWQLTP